MTKPKLTINVKAKIAEELCNAGVSISSVSRKYGISRAAVHKIKPSSAEMIQFSEENSVKSVEQVQLSRKGKFPEIDSALLMWFNKRRSEKVPLSHNLIQHKAKKLASEMNQPDFVASSGWLRGWLKRNHLKSKMACLSLLTFSFPVTQPMLTKTLCRNFAMNGY